MVAITFIEHDGTRHSVDVGHGLSLMEAATTNMVPGVDGMCGGICSCATCHCYIDANWAAKIDAPAEGELAMLESASHLKPGSRLGCQVVINEKLQGLEVHLPPTQGG